MQLITPPEISIQTYPYGWKQQQRFAVTLMLAVPLDNALPYSAQDAWSAIAEQIPADEIFDAGFPKPRAEALIYGHYHAPSGYAVSADFVELELGIIRKHLTVTGERQWRRILTPTTPEPLTKLALTYQNSFGGEDYDYNPSGIGFERKTDTPLPHLEYTNQLLTDKGQTPKPAGFNSVSVDWLPRKKLWGTYGDHWEKNEAPFFANDLNPDFFMQTSQDQWLSGYLFGGERFKLSNMHPDLRLIEGVIPSYRFKLLAGVDNKPEILTTCNIDTAIFLPDSNVLALLARAELPIHTMDGEEILYLTAAYEDAGETEKSHSHYHEHTKARIQGELDDEALLDWSPLRPVSVIKTLLSTGQLSQLKPPSSPKPTAEKPGLGAIAALGLGALATAAVVGAAMAKGKSSTGGETGASPEGTTAEDAAAETQAAQVETALNQLEEKLPTAMEQIQQQLTELGADPATTEKLLTGQSAQQETTTEDVNKVLAEVFPESEEAVAIQAIDPNNPASMVPLIDQKIAQLTDLQQENLSNLPSSGDPGFDNAIQKLVNEREDMSDLKTIPLDQVKKYLDDTNSELTAMLTQLPEHNEQMPEDKQIPSDALVDALKDLIGEYGDS